MAKKNILPLLLLTLLIVSGTDCKARNNNIHDNDHSNEVNIMELDMNIFCLLNLLESNMPLTRQKIMDIGFDLIKDEGGGGRTDYTATPIELNDGTILDGIELRDITTHDKEGTFFILRIKNKRITRRELEKNFGEFTLYALPGGHSIKETIVYCKRIGKFKILAAYGQEERDVLIGVSFDSIKRPQQ